MDTLEKMKQTLMEGQAPQLRELVQSALNEGMGAREILDQGLIPTMELVGAQFQAKEIYVPEVLLSARAMLGVMEILEPALLGAGVQPKAKLVLGTVQGDIHNIGKNLVGIMLKGGGFEVNDLGIDVSPETFVDAAKEEGVSIVCMSTLLVTSFPFMKATVEALQQASPKVKTMVGGAVVTPSYASSIGADGWAPNAAAAVEKAKELLNLS